MLGVLFPKILGRGAPMEVGIGGVSEFLQVVLGRTPLDICYDFAAVLNLIFYYHVLGSRAPKGR